MCSVCEMLTMHTAYTMTNYSNPGITKKLHHNLIPGNLRNCFNNLFMKQTLYFCFIAFAGTTLVKSIELIVLKIHDCIMGSLMGNVVLR